jgi:hypothetical protein
MVSQLKLEETQTDTSRTQELEKELKEKNILLKKLRHEGTSFSQSPQMVFLTTFSCNSKRPSHGSTATAQTKF